MLWIVHLFALVLFWPALFVTVPLHVIASRVAPKVQAGPPPLPGSSKSSIAGAIPIAIGIVAAFFYFIGSRPPPPVEAHAPTRQQTRPAPTPLPSAEAQDQLPADALWKLVQQHDSDYAYGLALGAAQRLIRMHPDSKEAKLAEESVARFRAGMAGQADFTVPSDPGAKFRQLHTEGPFNARKIVTLRDGSSGRMFSTRLYDCTGFKYQQLGAAESAERMRAYSGPKRWVDVTPNSIAAHIRTRACAKR
jgi:hypothetical protein